MTFRAGWWPRGVEPPPSRFETIGGVALEVPGTTPALAMSAAAALVAARPALAAVSTDAILRAIDATVAAWIAPDSPERRAAEAAFHAAAGVHPAAAPFGPLLDGLRGPALRDWIRAEVRPVEALDRLTPAADGVAVRAAGPMLAFHVLPGNVPLVWLPGLIACLVMRTPCLLKPAGGDPLTAALFCAHLAARLPELGDAVAVLPWAGGDEDIEREVLAVADAVIAFGGAASTASLLHRARRDATVIAHGPATAAAVIGREFMAPGKLEPLLAACARDALLYDGRGCLSLTELFLEEGGLLTPVEAAPLAGASLERATGLWPAGRADRDAAALTHTWRARVTARRIAGKAARCLAAPRGLDWTLLYDDDLPPIDAMTVRLLRLRAIRDAAGLPAALRGRATPVHAVAAGLPEPRRRALAADLAGAGVTRICAPGALQAPPVTWANGGASPFARLLRWTRVE